MKKLILMGMGFALACSLLAAQSARTVEVAFKTAQHKEEVEGDRKGAIEDYGRIVQGKDRALAAKALLRIAGIHSVQFTPPKVLFSRAPQFAPGEQGMAQHSYAVSADGQRFLVAVQKQTR